MDSSSATFLRLRTLIGTYLTNPPYRFIYDSAGHLVGEYDSNNTLRQETVWLGDMPVALIQNNAAGIQQVNYLLVDHLNTPRVVLSTTTNIPIWRWDNADPFGNAAPNQDPDGDGNKVEMNLRFPGQYYDIETGLFYNYFRDYNPAIGRYIASDPIGLDGGLNTYGYVGGNPVSLSDSKGLFLQAVLPWVFTGLGQAIIDAATIGLGGAMIADSLSSESSSSAKPIRSSEDEAQADAEHSAYKAICNTPPQPTGDKCQDLLNKIEWMQKCSDMRQAWDDRWYPKKHKKDIDDLNRGIKRLKRIYANSWDCHNSPKRCE